jgi:hypothetical protein
MIPSVEATSVQFALPLSVRKLSAETAKKTATASAPISAPSSGRRSSFVVKPTSASRSSTTLTGSLIEGVLSACLPLRTSRRPPRCPW